MRNDNKDGTEAHWLTEDIERLTLALPIGYNGTRNTFVGKRSMCWIYDTGKQPVHVPDLKARDAESFGKALKAIRTFDKGSGEIHIPVNAGRILKFRTTFDLFPEQDKPA